jgi:hypothetical protein
MTALGARPIILLDADRDVLEVPMPRHWRSVWSGRVGKYRSVFVGVKLMTFRIICRGEEGDRAKPYFVASEVVPSRSASAPAFRADQVGIFNGPAESLDTTERVENALPKERARQCATVRGRP